MVVFFASCVVNKFEKTIHGSYEVECRPSLYLNDSALVEGIVFDGQLRTPLARAGIFINHTEIRAISDSIGHFSFKLPEGKYSFRATAVGFDDMQTKKIKLKKHEQLKMKINLGTHIIYER